MAPGLQSTEIAFEERNMTVRSHLPSLARLDSSWRQSPGEKDIARWIEEDRADGILLEWGDDPAGLYTLLDLARRHERPLLPGRWIPARPRANGGLGGTEKILWIARSDGALRRLFSIFQLSSDELDGVARADEPLAVLGMPGDVIRKEAAGPGALRRRAEKWIGSLGADRVFLVSILPQGDELAELAQQWGLPCVYLLEPETRVEARTEPLAEAPLLWTDFQLDREHRLPDEAFVPPLKELLCRGSLLRERVRLESLPSRWRAAMEAELRLLHGWHLSPLLRSASALLQTLRPVPGVRLEAPLPQAGGVCAWLLGLSDRRPSSEGRLPAPEAGASSIARALRDWDRCLVVHLGLDAWPRLQGRLLSWLDGGHLAACPEPPRAVGRRFCYSGRSLWSRRSLERDRDGIPRMRLPLADRRALGWFEVELLASTKTSSPAAEPGTVHPRNPENIQVLSMASREAAEQLELGLGLQRFA